MKEPISKNTHEGFAYAKSGKAHKEIFALLSRRLLKEEKRKHTYISKVQHFSIIDFKIQIRGCVRY